MLTKKDSIKNEVKNSKNTKNASQTHEDQPQETHHHHGCCQPLTKSPMHSHTQQEDKKTSSKTRITIKYNAGYPNQLYIRGKGANLSWDKGQLLKNTKPDEWIWETDAHFTHCEFKILINDHVYENGDNHFLNVGSILLYTPHFY